MESKEHKSLEMVKNKINEIQFVYDYLFFSCW
jgi:hypothetical protein